MITRRDFLKTLPAVLSSALVLAEQPQEALAQTTGVNLDRFIGLPSNKLVIVTNRVNTNIYSTAAKKKVLEQLRRGSSLVLDTSCLKKGKRYTIIRIKLRGRKRGYIPVNNLRFTVLNTETFGLDTSIEKNRIRAAICQCGLKYLGNPWGYAHSFTKGIKCNEFCYRIYKKYGCELVGSSLNELAKSGKVTYKSKLKPGDLVTYSSSRKTIAHVAIYLGKGLIINASGFFGTTYPNGGIRISSFYYRSTKRSRYRKIVV